MKVSVVIPVYCNQDNLWPLYEDIKEKLLSHTEYEWEIVMVNDGSPDGSYAVMQQIAAKDDRFKIYSLSRNFGSHAAEYCGLSKTTGDCIVAKAADLQEPTEMILEMIESWKKGNNVVLAVRKSRKEKKRQVLFAKLYYWMVRKTAFPQMPKSGFDVYLIDRKVVDVLMLLDEKNSTISGQILWSGFKTDRIYYDRQERKIGKSGWTLRKKIKMVSDTLFGFTAVPIKIVTITGFLSFVGAIFWAVDVLVGKLCGKISVPGWTMMIIFQLLNFGIIMMTLGILGEYLWRTFDASRNRPPYIIEDDPQNDRPRCEINRNDEVRKNEEVKKILDDDVERSVGGSEQSGNEGEER